MNHRGPKPGPPTAFSRARPDDSSQVESYDDALGDSSVVPWSCCKTERTQGCLILKRHEKENDDKTVVGALKTMADSSFMFCLEHRS